MPSKKNPKVEETGYFIDLNMQESLGQILKTIRCGKTAIMQKSTSLLISPLRN